MQQRTRLGRVAVTSTLLFLAGCVGDETPVAPLSDELIVSPAFAHVASSATGDHLIALTREGAPSQDLLAAVRAVGGVINHRHDEIGVVSVSGLTDATAASLATRGDVEGIDRDYLVQWIPSSRDFSIETDQSTAGLFRFQWNIRQIQADAAWLTTGQGAGATVAILDSGGDPFHQDLAGKYDLAKSASMLTPGSSPCGPGDEGTILDFDTHGAFVAGVVSSNGIGIASVAPDATLIAVKVLNCSGSGSFDDVIDGILHAADVGADVMNMSLGAYFSQKQPGARELVKALQRAVSAATRRGTLVVASSGNEGLNLDQDPRDFIHVPSQLRDVMSVGATGPTFQVDFDALAPYSNFGRSGADIVAPGGNFGSSGNFRDGIISVCSTTSIYFNCGAGVFYLAGDGTSFASPHAAGAAAVVESQSTRNESGGKLGRCVVNGTDDLGARGVDPIYGGGRLNVLGAVECRGGDDDDDDDEWDDDEWDDDEWDDDEWGEGGNDGRRSRR